MKVVAKFYGRVNQFNAPPGPSYVTLKNASTGETVDTDAVSEKLLEKGIDHNDCEFEIIVQQNDDGKQEATLTKLEPKKLAEQELEQISKEVDGKLKDLSNLFNDNGEGI